MSTNHFLEYTMGIITHITLNEKSDLFVDFKKSNKNNLNNHNPKPNDVLFVIDMQYDFLPYMNSENYTNPSMVNKGGGGSFQVSEGEGVVNGIAELIKEWKGKIIATKDFHPKEHCSFTSTTGIYPPHCIAGTKGANIVKQISDALESKNNKNKNKVAIGYKGYDKTVNSYSGVKYVKKNSGNFQNNNSKPSINYVSSRQPVGNDFKNAEGKCTCSYDNQNNTIVKTGAIIVEFEHNKKIELSSVLNFGNNNNRNSRLIAESIKNTSRTVESFYNTNSPKNFYVCGLAGDYCVIDTAINLKNANPNSNVYIYADLTRYVLLPPNNFRPTKPSTIAKKCEHYGIKFIFYNKNNADFRILSLYNKITNINKKLLNNNVRRNNTPTLKTLKNENNTRQRKMATRFEI